MPLINMRREIPTLLEANETVWQHGHGQDGWRADSPLYLHTTDHGFCISDREMNGRDDSDFLMTVWNPDTCEAKETCFATTRGWSYPCYGSSPDAMPSVMVAYMDWRAREMRKWHALKVLQALDIPHVGATVHVYKGRKVPKGTVGKVLSSREEVTHVSRYGTWKTTRTLLMIAIEGRNATTHVDADHCKVIAQNPELVQTAFDMAETLDSFHVVTEWDNY